MRTASRSARARLPLEGVGPATCFLVTLAYLVVLGGLAAIHVTETVRLSDAGYAYVAVVAWFAGLGGAVASLHYIHRDVTKWNPAANLSYLVRPVTGAIVGSIAYFIYIVLAIASVELVEANWPERPSVLSMMIAFALGYREEIFRRLLQRVIDLIATVGGADTEPPTAPREVACRRTNADRVELTWLTASDNIAVIGYNIYRDYRFLAAIRTDDQGDGPGAGPRDQAPAEPARRLRFRDDNPVRVQHLYSVTAVDGAGNESEPAGPYLIVFADEPYGEQTP